MSVREQVIRGAGRLESRSLEMNSVWMVTAKALQMGAGFLFWVVAARNAEVVDVGVAAATVSAVMLCTQIGIVGTGSAVIVELGRGGDRQRVLDAAFSLMILASTITAVGYLILVGLGGQSVIPAGHLAGFLALFVLSSVLGTAVICLDQVSLALDRAGGGTLRYSVGGTLALVAVVVAAAGQGRVDALTLVACWTVGAVGAVAVGVAQLVRQSGYVYRPRWSYSHLRSVVRIGLPNQALTLTERVPPLLVPIILAHLVSPTQTAYWYPAWMMVWVAFTVPISVGLAQFSHGVRDPGGLRRATFSGMRLSALVGGAMCLALLLGAELFLSVLGGAYAEASVEAVRILTIGLLPYIVLQSYNAVCRAMGRTTEGILLGTVVLVLICAGTAVFGERGLSSVAVVWVSTTGLASLWALRRMRILLGVPPRAPDGLHRARRVARRARASVGRDFPWAEVLWGFGVAGLAFSATWVAVQAAATVDVPIDSDYGLVAVLPAGFWAGVVVLNVLMGTIALGRKPSPYLLGTIQVLLIGLLYGAPAIVNGTIRSEVAWRHLGIIRAMLGASGIDSDVDAYYSWPGFFAGFGALIQSTGIPFQDVALLAPLINALLWAAGVAMVARALTPDTRHVWLAVWLFTLTNWIDQDYLAPQAFSFFLFLVAIALVLRHLDARPTVSLRRSPGRGSLARVRTWWTSRRPSDPDARRRVAALCVVVFLAAVMIPSHQLSPFMLLAAVGVLTLIGRCWTPGVVVILALMMAIWLTTGASDYLHGHPVLFADTATGSAQANIGARLGGSDGHLIVVKVRAAMTALIFLLAMLGGLRMFLCGRRDPRPVLLMVIPFAMVPVQSYGGEMLMRSTLFALPFAAYLIAGLFLPRQPGVSRSRAPRMIALSLVLCVGLITSRYGNARFDMFTQDEIEGSAALYSLARPGALLIAGAHPTPWRYRNYTDFRHTTLTEVCDPDELPRKCYKMVREHAQQTEEGALVLLTRASRESIRMQGVGSHGAFLKFEALLVQSGDARLVFLNADTRIYQYPRATKWSSR